MTRTERHNVWRDLGAGDRDAAALTEYGRSGFGEDALDATIACPLPDEPFVGAWEHYLAEAADVGAADALCRPLIQLRFPIVEGISERPAYLAAVRRGVIDDEHRGRGAQFERPDTIRVFLHPTAAGRVPVIVAGTRADFVTLLRAVAHRNEPRPIPDALGASIIAGYNNWDRVAAIGPAFANLVANKALYQDRFVILSSGPYSGVPAADVGADAGEWGAQSLTIRLEHECAHYVTRHALGAMRNAMLDELIADYVGIVTAIGEYRAAWFLRFVGLDAASSCRSDGRIHSYRGTPPLSDAAFEILQVAIRRAAAELEIFDAGRRGPFDILERARMIVALANVGIEGLAAPDAGLRLAAAVADATRAVRARGAALAGVA